MRKRTILAISDFGTTGISESALIPLHHWHEQGHTIWHLALGYNGWAQNIDRERYPWYERLLPISGGLDNNTRFGQLDIARALELSHADIVFTSFDAWMVSYLAHPERFRLDPHTQEMIGLETRKFTHIAYFPLDGAVQNKYLPVTLDETICGFDVPVTYSRFAQGVIERDMSLTIPFIPIGHDPNVYRPGSRYEARDQMGIPKDKFIVGMVATNQYRKRWDDFFTAAIGLAKAHDDVLIVPWTTWSTQIMGGTAIPDLIWRSGVADQIINPGNAPGTLDDKGMAYFYQMLDVLVLTTVGEGAGLPPLRARACGIPALVSSNTSNTEFIAHHFEGIPNRGSFLDPYGSNIERFLTDTDSLLQKLERLYFDWKNDDSELINEIGRRGMFEMRQYEIENIASKWDALLEGIR